MFLGFYCGKFCDLGAEVWDFCMTWEEPKGCYCLRGLFQQTTKT